MALGLLVVGFQPGPARAAGLGQGEWGQVSGSPGTAGYLLEADKDLPRFRNFFRKTGDTTLRTSRDSANAFGMASEVGAILAARPSDKIRLDDIPPIEQINRFELASEREHYESQAPEEGEAPWIGVFRHLESDAWNFSTADFADQSVMTVTNKARTHRRYLLVFHGRKADVRVKGSPAPIPAIVFQFYDPHHQEIGARFRILSFAASGEFLIESTWNAGTEDGVDYSADGSSTEFDVSAIPDVEGTVGFRKLDPSQVGLAVSRKALWLGFNWTAPVVAPGPSIQRARDSLATMLGQGGKAKDARAQDILGTLDQKAYDRLDSTLVGN